MIWFIIVPLMIVAGFVLGAMSMRWPILGKLADWILLPAYAVTAYGGGWVAAVFATILVLLLIMERRGSEFIQDYADNIINDLSALHVVRSRLAVGREVHDASMRDSAEQVHAPPGLVDEMLQRADEIEVGIEAERIIEEGS